MTPFRPLATYRLQFNKNFRFKDALGLVNYFKDLGIDTIYASPIFKAIPGSSHGYDVVDPLCINPEIGTADELFNLVAALREAGMNWIQDIVPNHMAFHPDNYRLMDILASGAASRYWGYFDLDASVANGELLTIPFLSDTLDNLIGNGTVHLTKKDGKYFICEGNLDWPVRADMQQMLDGADLRTINADKAALKKIIEGQHYRLCDGSSIPLGVNYRRFFTVNGLICLKMEENWVFDDYHRYILQLARQGIFQGLRIDHVDGLYDPSGYLSRLREHAGPDCYITVEKILEGDELLPGEWPVQGSTGYDFLSISNNLFTRAETARTFEEIYQEFTGTAQIPELKKIEKKRQILSSQMPGELLRLVRLLNELNGLDISQKEAEAYMGDFLVSMPVYRFYDLSFPLKEESIGQVNSLLDEIGRCAIDGRSYGFWKYLLLDYPGKCTVIDLDKLQVLCATMMQYSGPVMAKGVEDTLMYTYNRFTAHAEVGDQAEQFGISIAEFHSWMSRRADLQALSQNATATHDTKKGEDVRTRLNVLSDVPQSWSMTLGKLMKYYQEVIRNDGLHVNDLYLLFQTVFGIYPVEEKGREGIADRLAAFMEKALREGKKRSDWSAPELEYEKKVKDFCLKICQDLNDKDHPLGQLLERVKGHAALNSFVQVILKVCCPGIPDFYQGCEGYDLSMVDPDNRRPVDYKRRKVDLEKLSRPESWQEKDCLQDKGKMSLISILLKMRKGHRKTFEDGQYLPLRVKGRYRAHVLAFLRHYMGDWILVAVPLGTAALMGDNSDINNFDWQDTVISLPPTTPKTWQNVLTGDLAAPDVLGEGLLLAKLFQKSPMAVCNVAKYNHNRSSGILMHVSSLPGEGAIGDLGREAYRFVDFLAQACQRYWQILPLAPVSADKGYSPYSTWSDRAGNIQLISNGPLAEWGLLTINSKTEKDGRSKVDFATVDAQKQAAIDEAYQAFRQLDENSVLKQEFQGFRVAESSWLTDHALYCCLSMVFRTSWRFWPEELKWRNSKALETYKVNYAWQIEKYEWEQFVFWKQWEALRQYARNRGVSFIGDLSFYVDLDSVEVWCHPEYFKLDEDANPLFQAGVPPDYFNIAGQLWGMPVYDWEQIALGGYAWWIDRICYQLSRFDELRLDHFRAFSAFYQVPRGDGDAKNGNWEEAPGAELFAALEKKIGSLPLIAEDLGEITPQVSELMEKFRLPGMKVLQFAFGSDMAISPHIPHAQGFGNGVVYTGTHDNNTSTGWFVSELDEKGRQRLQAYLGQAVDAKNVARELVRLALSSSAFRAIIPMQDIIGLGREARMNCPGLAKDNWAWRLSGREDYGKIAKRLSLLNKLFGRDSA